MREAAIFDQPQRILKHRLGLGGEAGDEVGPENHVRAQPTDLVAEADRVGAQVAPFHPLEDHVVAGLERQVQMRHQSVFLGEGGDEIRIGLDRVDRRQPQPFQVRHLAKKGPDKPPEPRPPGRSPPQLVMSTPLSTTSA